MPRAVRARSRGPVTTWVRLAAAAGALLLALVGSRRSAATVTRPSPAAERGRVPEDFPSALVAFARADVGRVRETSPNRSPEIDRMLAATGQAPGQNWCAAALSSWIRDASTDTGIAPPGNSAGARALVDQLRHGGFVKWMPAPDLPADFIPPVGAIGLWDRSTEPGGWQAHVGVATGEGRGPRRWASIEGNGPPTGDRVAEITRSLDDPRLLGFAVWRVREVIA